MKRIILALALFGLIMSCEDTSINDINNAVNSADSLEAGDLVDAAEDSSTQMEEDTTLTGKLTNLAFFKDTTLEVTGVIIKIAVDSSSLSTIATLAAGESLSVDAEGKVAVIKTFSADSVLLAPINLPAEYLDLDILESYVKVLYAPTKMDIPEETLQNAKIVALKAITKYNPANIDPSELLD